MDDSDDSSLSSTHSTDDEALKAKMANPGASSVGIGRYFKPLPKNKEPTPEPPKRAPSPPHEYTLADNDAIAFIVMFRSRFSDAFAKSVPHYGPQDIERGLLGEIPEEHVEKLLCALLSIVLNRKKDVEKGHYGRALEDAISQNQNQWPAAWNGVNPLHGGNSFNSMTPEQRLILLKSLVLWALNSSEAVQTILKQSYKQTRRDDDKNQPKSVQPWFTDSYRRKYYLVEGQEDTHFRIYRENDGKTAKTNTWFSVAGSIDEVNLLVDKFEAEGTQQARVNSLKLRSAIPRFEMGEEKRRRRDYRLARKAAFSRPEPGFSMYEGRTRGKRMRYTFSDGEEEDSDMTSDRRSTRHSGVSTPQEVGPTVTASGRQVKSRLGGMYGESILVDQRKEIERTARASTETGDETAANNGERSARTARPSARGRYADGIDSESESDTRQSSGKEWSGNEEESDVESEPDVDDEAEDEDMSETEGVDDVDEDDNTQESLVVQLRYRPGSKVKPNENGRLPTQDSKATQNITAYAQQGTTLKTAPPDANTTSINGNNPSSQHNSRPPPTEAVTGKPLINGSGSNTNDLNRTNHNNQHQHTADLQKLAISDTLPIPSKQAPPTTTIKHEFKPTIPSQEMDLS